VAVKRKPSYRRQCETHIRTWLEPFFGSREIATITALDVARLQAHIAGQPVSKGKGRTKPPKAKTVNNVIGTLGAMLQKAVEWKYIRENPCTGIEPLDVGPDAFAFAFYDEEQSEAFLTTAARVEPAWYPLFLAGFRTGLREGELFALEWTDLDFVKGVIHVRRAWDPREGICTLPKGGRSREVFMSPALAAVLRGHRHLRGKLVFCDHAGDYLTRDMLKHPWERVRAASGLPRIRPHDMRHSFASQLVMKGTPLRAVQQLLGHADVKTTERYSHLAPGAESRYVALLDGSPSGHTLATPGAETGSAAVGIPRRKRNSQAAEMVEAKGVEPLDATRRGDR
jgi:integrase